MTEPAEAEAPQAILTARGVRKRFGRFPALDDAEVEVREGEILALLGPSGSGKTTLLRIIAGLEQPDAGEVTFRGRDLLAVPPRRRRIGMVFQHYALFRHMTVAENIAFGLKAKPRAKRPSRNQIAFKVEQHLKRVQLEDLGKRYPAQLSGGQRQRVALARALATEPDLLLLDEPFGALDASVRLEMRRWVKELHADLGLTTVFVTHDRDEALDLADRITVLKDGRVMQSGTPKELYENPVDPFVFEFLGGCLRLPVTLTNGAGSFGGAPSERAGPGDISSGPALAYVRPEAIEIAAESPGLRADVIEARSIGARTQFTCRIAGSADETARLFANGEAEQFKSDTVFLRPGKFHLF